MQPIAQINPFYAARITQRNRRTIPDYAKPKKSGTQYAKLPRAPINASPVPHLTSLYHFDDPGSWGDRRYPGNCAGGIIRDLLLYFQPKTVFDPMTGSGTCRDVCRDLDIACVSYDLKTGFDACDPASWQLGRLFDFVWIHPPYFRQKIYSNSEKCMSQAGSLSSFLSMYQRLLANCAGALNHGGHLAVLMGDYQDRDEGYCPLVYWTKRLAFHAGLRQACTDIIRFSHNASSSRKVYRSKFIPGLHDVCMIFQQPKKEGE